MRGRVGSQGMAERRRCTRPTQNGPAGTKCTVKKRAALRRLGISVGFGAKPVLESENAYARVLRRAYQHSHQTSKAD